MMLLLFDNYDSFTYNVFQLLSELGAEVDVVRNDVTTLEELESKNYSAIVISPGPGVPRDAGLTEDLIRTFKDRIPILGICLGHQAIGEVFGGRIIRASQIVHGKISTIKHHGTGIYKDLPKNLQVGRYHSLIIDRENFPNELEITSELEDGTIMGVKHKNFPVEGIQFHPESILTPDGKTMMKNFLDSL